MKFSLPIYQSSGQPYKSADDLLNRLARETAGTYLVGKSNFWHGGIHVTDKIAPHCVKNDMVRCMADGTVVAYRINADYLQSKCMGETLKYSTGFVLVRHDYKSAENSEEGPNKGKRNELTFYSLYMHVAPYSVYGGYAGKSVYKITADNLRARTEASLSGAEIGFLKTGAEIEVQETREVVNGNQKYLFARATLKSGAIRNGNAVVDQGSNPFWVAIEQTSPAVKKFAIHQAQKVPELPFYLQGKCIAKTRSEVNARTDDSGAASSICGTLPVGTELTFDRRQEKTLTIDDTRYRFAPCTIQRCSAPDWESWPSRLWVSVEERFVDIIGIQPDHLDEVVACRVSVKAGDKLARLGLYESTASLIGGKDSKHLVHVEMFSFDARLESFLNNSAGLTHGGKFLRLEKGHKLHKRSGTAEAVEFVEGDKRLSRMAVVPMMGLKKHKDKAGKSWLEVTIEDKAGGLQGYVAEEDANRVSQHDWMKLGFQTVKAPESFDGYLARTGIPPFFKELYQKIADEPVPEDRDKIRAALTHADNCAVWSKIVARHPSEWKHPSGHGTWSVLDRLLKSAPELLAHEKERIDKCVWWDDVAGKVPGFDRSGVVWHFHPVGMVSNFIDACSGECIVDAISLDTTLGKFLISKKLADYLLETEKYRKYPYALPDSNSGITIGYGYDLGQQSEAAIEADLEGIYDRTEIDRLKACAGLRGKIARSYIHKVVDIDISKENAAILAMRLKRRYAQQVVDIYPESIHLHPDCQGVLLSLVFNRGNDLVGERRAEMKQIQHDLANGMPEMIPARLRSMKRLWNGDRASRGLVIRREKEAKFFEEAIKCTCW